VLLSLLDSLDYSEISRIITKLEIHLSGSNDHEICALLSEAVIGLGHHIYLAMHYVESGLRA